MNNNKPKTTTDPQDELLTQVDQNNQVIGSISRKIAHNNPNVYYRIIFILIKNENKILIQKRSPTKDLFPNCWDLSVGGHVDYGKTNIETAKRELKEEVNIDADEKDFISKGQILIKLPKSNEFCEVFEYNLKPDQKILTENKEITDTAWMTIQEIKKSIAGNSLPWYERPIKIISTLY